MTSEPTISHRVTYAHNRNTQANDDSITCVTTWVQKIDFLRSSLPLHGVVTGGCPCLPVSLRAPTTWVARAYVRMCRHAYALWRTLVRNMTGGRTTPAHAKVQEDGGYVPLFDSPIDLARPSQVFPIPIPPRRYNHV